MSTHWKKKRTPPKKKKIPTKQKRTTDTHINMDESQKDVE